MSDEGGPLRNALMMSAGLACWALASLDDVIGIGTRRHTRRFLSWPIDGVPIADLLRSRATIDGWAARHRECVHESERARVWLEPFRQRIESLARASIDQGEHPAAK